MFHSYSSFLKAEQMGNVNMPNRAGEFEDYENISDDDVPTCAASGCFKNTTNDHLECCHEVLCDEHYGTMVGDCNYKNCTVEICDICAKIDGFLCSVCGYRLCSHHKNKNKNKCKCE